MNKELAKQLKAKFPEIDPAKKGLTVNASADTLDLTIYGEIEGDGYDWWADEVIKSETSARHFKEVLDAHPNVKVINLSINSMGGSVFEGNAIYSLLKRHSAVVNVTIDGFACSMASSIAMAGDKVTMSCNSLMMIHNPWTWACGNSVELRKAADDLDAMGEAFRQTYLVKAGDKLTEEKLIEMLDAETYLTAKEAYEFGLCDEIEDVVEDNEPSATINALKAQVKELKAQLEGKTKEEDEEEQPTAKGWFF